MNASAQDEQFALAVPCGGGCTPEGCLSPDCKLTVGPERDEAIAVLLELGREHEARERFGDRAVTAAIRRDVEAAGFDFVAVCADANGFEASESLLADPIDADHVVNRTRLTDRPGWEVIQYADGSFMAVETLGWAVGAGHRSFAAAVRSIGEAVDAGR